MDRRRKIWATLFVLATVLGACGIDDEPADEANDVPTVLDTPTIEDSETAGPDVVEGYLLFDRPFLADSGLAEPEAIVEDLEREAAIVSLQDFFAGFDGEFRQAILDTPVYDVFEQEVAIVNLAGGSIDETLHLLLEMGIGPDAVAPIHNVSSSGHWSAYPGTHPVQVAAQPWNEADDNISTTSAVRTIGIVDTGIASGSPNATAVGVDPVDTHHSICHGALHGEAVASAIMQVNPNATVYSANAFPTADRCWVTNEIDVLVATAFLQRANERYDAINFSLGTAAYHHKDPETQEDTGIKFPPIALKKLVRDIPAFSAAGNDATDEVIYPAAYTTAVFAAGPDGAAVVWETDGTSTAPSRPVAEVAPGCALVLQGISDGGNGLDTTQVVVWAGSSFASPIYAALGPTVMKSVNADEMYGKLLPDRMDNTRLQDDGDHLYPNAPTDCDGP